MFALPQHCDARLCSGGIELCSGGIELCSGDH